MGIENTLICINYGLKIRKAWLDQYIYHYQTAGKGCTQKSVDFLLGLFIRGFLYLFDEKKKRRTYLIPLKHIQKYKHLESEECNFEIYESFLPLDITCQRLDIQLYTEGRPWKVSESQEPYEKIDFEHPMILDRLLFLSTLKEEKQVEIYTYLKRYSRILRVVLKEEEKSHRKEGGVPLGISERTLEGQLSYIASRVLFDKVMLDLQGEKLEEIFFDKLVLRGMMEKEKFEEREEKFEALACVCFSLVTKWFFDESYFTALQVYDMSKHRTLEKPAYTLNLIEKEILERNRWKLLPV